MSRRKNVTSATTTSSTDARPAEDDIDGDVIINFAKVPTDSKSEHSSENWYREQAEAVPYKEIGFACLLFVMGSVCLALSALIAAGQLDSSLDDRMWPTLVLGVLMDLPGGYYLGMVVCVLLKVPGWTWSQLPQMN